MTYRGITYTKEQLITEARKARPGIYRGVKHEGTTEEPSKPKKGVYRGVKWDGRS